MCKKCQVSFSLVNPKGKCWIRPGSSGDSQVMCCVFRLRNRFAAPVSAHTFHQLLENGLRSITRHCARSAGPLKVWDQKSTAI